ncbi:MAG TPA: hypothetical protein VH639_04330 [Bryobacteraceae bacterium]
MRIPSINAEDGPRGADRVYGLADARQRYGRAEQFDFSCAVNLERGQVRSLDVNPRKRFAAAVCCVGSLDAPG